MGGPRPELLFVSGPQQGERAVLMGNIAVLGRAATADVRIVEEHVSREHVRFQLSREGWIVQNLSANGTRINGKKYKKPKQILLDTGDMLAVGVETAVLFVAAGDDPEEALQTYRQAHPAAEAQPAQPAEAAEPAPRQAGATAKPPPPAEAPAKPKAPEKAPKPQQAAGEEAEADDAQAEEDEDAGSKKVKLVLFGVVIVGLCGFGFVLIRASGREDEQGGESGVPRRLTNFEIAEAIRAPMERSPSPTKAAEVLDLAVRSYTNRASWETGDLYQCVRNFKLHRAYRHSRSFDRVQHEQMFADALKELIKLVVDKYDAAWKFEKAKSYRNAQTVFEEFLQILPMAQLQRGEPARDVIMDNVIDHLNFIKKKLARKKAD